MTDHDYEEWLLARCCVCGQSFTITDFKNEDLVHTPHEPDCPNYRQDEHTVDCECALYAHAACCPECVELEDQEAHIDDTNKT